MGNAVRCRYRHFIAITGRVGEDDDGDRDYVSRVRLLTVSEAKTEIMCLQTKCGGHVPFTVTAVGQVYKQAFEFAYLGGAISAD